MKRDKKNIIYAKPDGKSLKKEKDFSKYSHVLVIPYQKNVLKQSQLSWKIHAGDVLSSLSLF